MLDIAIVIPELAKYGGAERVVIECAARWQEANRVTIYTTKCELDLLAEYGLDKRVRIGELSAYFEGDHGFFLNGTLLPKLWEQEIAEHEIYFCHLWPTHLIERHPLVWYPHEPPRMLSDLRHAQPPDDQSTSMYWHVHCYPKLAYDDIPTATYEATLNALSLFNLCGHPDRIVANSRHTARYLEAVYGVDVPDVVYPGVALPSEPPTASESNRLLTVGQLWPHKRIRLLLEAVSLVSDVSLTVVGQGPDREKLIQVAENLGIGDRTTFLERVPDEQLKQLYSDSFAVLFAPVKEPFGIVALEALAAARPLIAVAEGGFTEVVTEDCARLVPAEPAKFAEQIIELHQNRSLAADLGRNGYRRAGEYSWNRTAERLLEILQSTAKANRTAGSQADIQSGRPLIGAQYYCWYGEGLGGRHWNDNSDHGGVVDMPAAGYYCSDDGTILEQHLNLCESSGIDFLIANLHLNDHGVNEHELSSIRKLFHLADERSRPPHIALQLCPYSRNPEHLERLLSIANDFSKRQSYLQVNGAPVLFIFWSGSWDGDGATIELLRTRSQGFMRIATSLRMFPPREEALRTFRLFDAWTLFSPLEIGSENNWEPLWQQSVNDGALPGSGLRIFSVSPGYDDRHLTDSSRSDNPYRLVDRNRGETYSRMWDFIEGQKQPLDMILISTFNEFHENTQIEPSAKVGDYYLVHTRQRTAALKQSGRTPAFTTSDSQA